MTFPWYWSSTPQKPWFSSRSVHFFGAPSWLLNKRGEEGFFEAARSLELDHNLPAEGPCFINSDHVAPPTMIAQIPSPDIRKTIASGHRNMAICPRYVQATKLHQGWKTVDFCSGIDFGCFHCGFHKIHPNVEVKRNGIKWRKCYQLFDVSEHSLHIAYMKTKSRRWPLKGGPTLQDGAPKL